MILEIATLNVRAGQSAQFEQSFAEAQAIISSVHGYVSHQLRRCIEDPNKYVLLVQWNRLEDHTIGFRQSPEFQRWRALLHHFYDPPPTIEHFEVVLAGGS
jgi:heme-degrading monooxygenase HmoA